MRAAPVVFICIYGSHREPSRNISKISIIVAVSMVTIPCQFHGGQKMAYRKRLKNVKISR